jgi:hypothetical protein
LECQVTSVEVSEDFFNRNISYNIGQGLKETSLPKYTVIPKICEGTINIDIMLASNGRMLQASPWIWVSNDLTKLNLSTSDFSLLG